MSSEPVAPKKTGVSVTLLAVVDLGPQIAGMTGRQIRYGWRTSNCGPGAGWPEHRNTGDCLENRGTIPAVEILVASVRQE